MSSQTLTSASVAEVTKRIQQRQAKVGIIGLGYVGLPLALLYSEQKVSVTGFDIDERKISTLRQGGSYIYRIEARPIKQAREQGFDATSDYARIKEMDAIIICVPTPLNEYHEPDLSYITNTAASIAPHLRAGQLVVLESPTYPGTTEEVMVPILEKGNTAGLKGARDDNGQGAQFYVAFSPEREDPGNAQSNVATIPKVVGGYTPACLERAKALYGRAIRTIVTVSSCRAAEATKLLENIFRSVNIALVNELKIVYSAMGIDVWEVINAAKTKPFGFMPFYPGPGLGGHCIPIDPFYLTWKAREYGQNTRFIELAGEVNSSMPEYVIHRVGAALNSRRKAINGSKVLILGLAYKPNVDDERESPSYVLMDLLHKLGAKADYYDPYVPIIRPTREHPHWAGTKSIRWNEKVIRTYDVVLIATNHQAINYQQLAEWSSCIVDTRNAMVAVKTKGKQVWKA